MVLLLFVGATLVLLGFLLRVHSLLLPDLHLFLQVGTGFDTHCVLASMLFYHLLAALAFFLNKYFPFVYLLVALFLHEGLPCLLFHPFHIDLPNLIRLFYLHNLSQGFDLLVPH